MNRNGEAAMNELSERDKLIEMGQVDGMTDENWADFIIADRERILNDLRDARLEYAGRKEIFPLIVAIDKTFRTAGVEL